MAEKRAASPPGNGVAGNGQLVKRQRTDNELIAGTITKEGIKRTSNLFAPIMQLTGHEGEVFSMRFHPDGKVMASAGFDKTVMLWRVYGEECENHMLLRGHKNAILEVHWFPGGEQLLTCSADKTLRCWDAAVGMQVKRVNEHGSFVNSCSPARRGPPMFVSGSDDKTIKVHDMRQKRSVQTMEAPLMVTAVAFSDAGDQVYSGGLDNAVHVWDLRKGAPAFSMAGHTDTVTGIKLSPDGHHLLSNAMDNTLRMWDVRPYAPDNRCVKVFTGHQHNFERTLLRCDWAPDGDRVTAGSADRVVYVWDTASRNIQYALPGHKGSVNEAVFHPSEPIIGSASSDRTIFLGELAS